MTLAYIYVSYTNDHPSHHSLSTIFHIFPYSVGRERSEPLPERFICKGRYPEDRHVARAMYKAGKGMNIRSVGILNMTP